MIRALRQRHRRTFLALGIIVPVAFAIGIAARKPLPEVNSLPTEIAPVTAAFAVEIWSRADLFPKSPVQVRLLRKTIGSGKFAVAFSAAKNFVKPDLLVYWSAGNSTSTNALPASAILLGAFTGSQLALPLTVEKKSGVLLLYSLADNEIVDESKPIHFDDSTN
jgi:hypothetical protein